MHWPCRQAFSVRPGATRCWTLAESGHAGHRRTWEAATLLALRDRLRAGDIWVEGSRQWRAIEDLINDKMRLLVRLGGALIAATQGDADLDGAVADSVGWERLAAIREHWGEILRLVASLQAGTVLPSAMLKRLAADQRQNQLDLAL